MTASNSQWPFYPYSLGEIFDDETLAVIETGSSERIKRPLTILDFDPQTQKFSRRIQSLEESKRYEPFCRLLRKDAPFDRACRDNDIFQTNASQAEFKKTGCPYRDFSCHMGLKDITYIIQVHGHPAAIMISGQYGPPEGNAAIQARLANPSPADRGPVVAADQVEPLQAEAEKLPVYDEKTARVQLEREALHLQRIAEDKFEREKRRQEQDFLLELRRDLTGVAVSDRRGLSERLTALLSQICIFLGCEYAVFYGSQQEKDTVLTPLAFSGLPEEMVEEIPHFNWKKAGLPELDLNLARKNLPAWSLEARTRGIRGKNQEFFSQAGLVLPNTLADRYFGVLVLGPLPKGIDLSGEIDFLIEIGSLVSMFALTGQEILYLEQERRLWKNSSSLLMHQVKTMLMTINTDIGRVRAAILNPRGGLDLKKMDELLRQAEDQAITLANSATETLRQGHLVIFQPNDMQLESYSLSVLVGNCAWGFNEKARSEHRELVIDPSIEWLPISQVDVARLSVAISNLLDNAIKYSYEGTKIFLRGRIDRAISGKNEAVIEVIDFGNEIRPDEREKIFEEGVRSQVVLRSGKIPGSGLGLWEARMIVAAHSGTIQASSEPTSMQRREGRTHRAVFTIRLPIVERRQHG